MGCGNSSIKSNQVTSETSKRCHPLVLETASAFQKIRAYEAIKKNDHILIEKALQEIQPIQNLGFKGDNYTLFHAAAQFNSFSAMQTLISWLKTHRSSEVETVMGIADSDGMTPIRHAVSKNASETFYVMLSEGAVKLTYTNSRGQTLLDICNQYSNLCLDVYKAYEKGDKGGFSKKETENNKDPKNLSNNQSLNNKTSSEEEGDSAALKRINTMVNKVQRFQTQSLDEAKSMKNPTGQESTENLALHGVPVDSKVYKMLTELIKSNGEFQDPDFPVKLESILTEPTHQYLTHFRTAVWRRPHELFKCGYDQISVFDNIDVNDIAQGLLGVCYLLSALSALTEFPSRLTPIYLNKTANKFGIYGLRFYVRGIPTEVIIDDWFPCYGDRALLPLFSKPKGKELWVLLAEKAWAKLYNNYVACECGFMDEALEYLLGVPSIRYLTQDQDVKEITKILVDADSSKYVICGATSPNASQAQGLVASHAYSIISVHTLAKYNIIKLRNPWGKFEWNGDFGDSSKLWTPEIKAKVGYTNADDGIFCMTVDDFKKNFEFYSIALYQEGWEYTYLEAESHPNHAEYFKFTIDQPCVAYFRIHQDDKRALTTEQKKDFKYASGDLIVVRVNGENKTLEPTLESSGDLDKGFYWGGRSIFPTKHYKLRLSTPGEYLIRTKIRWRNGKKEKFTLSAYAPFKIEMEKVIPVKDFMMRMFKHLGDLGTKTQLNGCSISYAFYLHYLYFSFENPTQKKWKFNLTFPKLVNVRLPKAYKKGEDSLYVEVEAGEKLAIHGKKIDITLAASFEWQLNTIA